MIKMTAERLKYGDPKKAVKAGVTVSNLSIGVAIASQAKLLAQVDSGQLRNSLSASNLKETKLLNDQKKYEQAEPLETTGLKEGEVYVGSNCDHNIYQEYGTVLQPAQPYLRPSAELVIEKKEPAEVVSKYCREKMEEELEKRKKLKAEGKNPWT